MTSPTASHPSGFAPYDDPARDTVYNLLFCDDLAAYRASFSGDAPGPWKALFASKIDTGELQRIAADASEESRIRVLACRALNDAGRPLASRELLGLIVERPMPEGLDVLAVYPDHRVRYLNHSGRMLIWEAADKAIDELIDRVLQSSEQVIARIGPWDKPRLAPPSGDSIRLTFLVSHDLYFGQGAFDVLAQDSIGGPVIAAATRLLAALVEKSTTRDDRG